MGREPENFIGLWSGLRSLVENNGRALAHPIFGVRASRNRQGMLSLVKVLDLKTSEFKLKHLKEKRLVVTVWNSGRKLFPPYLYLRRRVVNPARKVRKSQLSGWHLAIHATPLSSFFHPYDDLAPVWQSLRGKETPLYSLSPRKDEFCDYSKQQHPSTRLCDADMLQKCKAVIE